MQVELPKYKGRTKVRPYNRSYKFLLKGAKPTRSKT